MQSESLLSTNTYWKSSLNTSNPLGGALFTDTVDNSQWACFAEDNGASSVKLAIVHIANGKIVTYMHDSSLPLFTVAGGPANEDQHNGCSIALDKNGFIHVTYDQHTSPLKYFKSTFPRFPYAWSGPLTMVNATVENSITFPVLFSNPANGELYFTFEKGGGYNAAQYFYHYNAATPAWEASTGTAAGGQITSNTGGTNATVAAFNSGLPQWDKTIGVNGGAGNLWFNFQFSAADGPGTNCGGTLNPCGEYLLGWNGSSFVKPGGAAQTVPVAYTATPAYTVNATADNNFTVFDSFSIDSNRTFFLPYLTADSNGFLQVYVVENSTGSFIKHQLTSNSSVFNPPVGAGWLGPGAPATCTGGVSVCPGLWVQSVTAISSGTCTWVTYSDIFNWANGHIAIKSCDNFHSSTSSYWTTRFNPNQIIFPDQVRNFNTGGISFLFQYSNDVDIRFSTMFSASSVDIGKIWLETIQ